MDDQKLAIRLHGPRQFGKTTLARLIGDKKGIAYFTFDDDVQRAAAQADPVGYVSDLPERAVLDEVQRVPDLPGMIHVNISMPVREMQMAL